MTADPWTVRTPDLVLRHTAPDDVEQIVAWRNQPEVIRWLLRTRVTADGIRERLRSLGPESLSVSAWLGDRIIATGFLEVRDGMGQDDGDAHVGAEGLLGYLVDPAHAGRGCRHPGGGGAPRGGVRRAWPAPGDRRLLRRQRRLLAGHGEGRDAA